MDVGRVGLGDSAALASHDRTGEEHRWPGTWVGLCAWGATGSSTASAQGRGARRAATAIVGHDEEARGREGGEKGRAGLR